MALEVASGEHIIYEGHPSWRSILTFYLVGVVAAVALGVIAFLVLDAVGIVVGVVVLLIVLFVGWLKRVMTVYAISNQRLRIKRGIIARNVQEARLARVQNVNIQQGVAQRMLAIGDVDFDTAGSGDADFRFDGVASPSKVVEKVDQAHREAEQALRAGAAGQGGLA
jgi:uncharacterized membrane protein YdbT with pleckstrin-like domain